MRRAHQLHCSTRHIAIVVRLTYLRGSTDPETGGLFKNCSQGGYADPNDTNEGNILQNYERCYAKHNNFGMAYEYVSCFSILAFV
jgi:hypothetical protein